MASENGLWFDKQKMERYKKAGYKLVGKHKHSAVKLCKWAKSAIREGKLCYKKWYGIASHRCVQMTPTLNFCDFSCQFCWRTFGKDRFKSAGEWDDPKTIVDEAIVAQRKLVSGFGANPKIRERFREAMEPAHFAISLDGEATLYPHIAGLIREIKSRGYTAFLVTNGTFPDKLKELLEKDAAPTNLYVSVYSADADSYQKITNSFLPDAFERVTESIKLLKDFEKAGCRTIFRMTCVKGLNMDDAEGYSKLIKLAEPKFVELKGYAWMGESRNRLKKENTPEMEDLMRFANDLEKLTGYKIKLTDDASRVVMLTN